LCASLLECGRDRHTEDLRPDATRLPGHTLKGRATRAFEARAIARKALCRL